MMLERILFNVLAAGREEINENPEFLEHFFQDEQGPGLSKAEIDQIRTYWQNVQALDPDGSKQIGVSIVHQFPRETTIFPCWAIVLLGEQEDQQVLGDEAGYIGDQGEDVLSSFWAKSYAIFTYVPQSPLLALYYYELCKFFVTRGRPFLKSAAGGYTLSTKFSGGDMAPDPRYDPAIMFVRRFQVDLTREERVLGNPQLRARTVRGIHVPETEAAAVTIADVTANVTPFQPGDDE